MHQEVSMKKKIQEKQDNMNKYFVQLFTMTVILWKLLFIPYKLYHINLLDIVNDKDIFDFW